MFDVTIIGGGIIGLASGYKLIQKQPAINLLILEKESALATHQTGHNSGVIHSGIYYKPGSLKARNCISGVKQLLSFCEKNDIPYELCGKVIVATAEDELPRLNDLYQRGVQNGVPDLKIIGPKQLKELEPHVAGIKAIQAPSTGIIDFSQVAHTMASLIQDQGGTIKTSAEVSDLVIDRNECRIETTQGDFTSQQVINCAGLQTDKVAGLSGFETDLKIIPFRGEYYTLNPQSRKLVNNLIYPVPDPRFPFLGVHFTRKLDGLVEAGPNAVLALAREGYKKSDFSLMELWDTISYGGFWKLAKAYWLTGSREYWRSLFKPAFVKALQRLVPEITSDDLFPGGSGVRAQAVSKDGQIIDDFYIRQTGRVIHVLNAPSPAATASFAIADEILTYLD